MSNERAPNLESSRYTQHGDVEMAREGDVVYPDFRFEENPGMDDVPSERIGYPLGLVPKGEDVEYGFPGEPEEYPELDFRALANELDDDRGVPSTSYLTHTIHKHPAIFIPHIPSYIIRRFTNTQNEDGERPLILDPFSGSGTTGLEAKINGRDYLGVEINPLSHLVSEVATSPIPPSTLDSAEDRYLSLLNGTQDKLYEEYNTEFLDGTNKEHWFEPEAIRGLTRIRKALSDFKSTDFDPIEGLNKQEGKVVSDIGEREIRTRVDRWLTLLIANTVFEVSNADPGVSKAYKSKKMRRRIEGGEHPPDVIETHREQISLTKAQLVQLWNEIYGTNYRGGTVQRTLKGYSREQEQEADSLKENRAHLAEVDIRLGDARTFDFPEYKEEIDLAVTSPPYINAMNYYRGSKLRLFWLFDFLEEDEKFDATELRKSIVGTNSVSMKKVDRDLPASLRSIWTGSSAEFDNTRLPRLDEDIREIHALDHNDAEKKSYVTWRFFAKDMLQNLARVYEHQKPGAYYFFVIGENTIGERLIHSHKYVADIAENLGKFEGHGGTFEENEGFRLVGSGWDEITNRDLFQDRDHSGGVIECEWVTILQKPKNR